MNVGKSISLLSAALLVAVTWSSPQVPAGESEPRTRGSDTLGTWAEFRGNLNNTGYSTSTVPRTNNFFLNFSTGWSFRSSPVVGTGILYFGTDGYMIHAVNIGTGQEIWNYTAGRDFWSTPLVVGSAVYAGSEDGKLYSFDRFDGSLKWFFQANGSISSSAKSVDGTLVFGSYDGYVYFVNATTGLQTQPPFVTGGQIWGTPAIVEGTVIIGSNDGNISRFRLSDRSVVWNYTLPPSPLIKYSSAAVHSGRVFIGSDDTYAYALDLNTGALVWRFQTGSYVYSSPGVHNGKVFIHSTDGYLYALPFDDPNMDGEITLSEIVWRFHTGDGGSGEGGSSPAIADGKVLVGVRDGVFFCINETTGQEVWNFTTIPDYPASFSSPAVADGMVFVGLSDRSMYGFAPSAPGMSVSIAPALDTIEGQRAMEIVFNVTLGGLPVEGAFVSFGVTAGTLSQSGASTLEDGLQRVKYLAPKVDQNTSVKVTAKATKYGMADAFAFVWITVTPDQDYGIESGTGFSLEKYSLLLVVIAGLAVMNAAVYVALIFRKKRLST